MTLDSVIEYYITDQQYNREKNKATWKRDDVEFTASYVNGQPIQLEGSSPLISFEIQCTGDLYEVGGVIGGKSLTPFHRVFTNQTSVITYVDKMLTVQTSHSSSE